MSFNEISAFRLNDVVKEKSHQIELLIVAQKEKIDQLTNVQEELSPTSRFFAQSSFLGFRFRAALDEKSHEIDVLLAERNAKIDELTKREEE